jgi:hypothetical protein
LNEVKTVLYWGAAICAIFAASWVWRAKKDPLRGWLMAGAFVLMGVLCVGYAQEWPLWVTVSGAVLVGICLFVDVAVRASRAVPDS